ncbi:trypsin-like serine protease [Rhodoferax sp.]|uniref:trypsin-like serine protease n=1 Tax=Rhodoferax sp. TaxID=50421 RepID=UPI00261846FB|nr:trypsin-like serine protease [Rhodoferax sp.]MDD5479261.1 trypsin-like serine protease [Rhodoferax sp.]
MVTTTAYYTDSRYRTNPGEGFDGVVRVSYGGYYGTGALLFSGHAILTATHLFASRSGSASVMFETSSGTQTSSVAKILQHPGYDAGSNNDLAIVWLAGSAPQAATRYDIYRSNDEIGQPFTLVGYGQTGTGNTGATSTGTSSPIRLKATNAFDADTATLKSGLSSGMTWSPLAGTQLVADFDNGTTAHDALGRLLYRNGLGQGLDEGLIAPGDSGGPAFLNGDIAGVASYTTSLSTSSVAPDIDTSLNSSFGEIAAWQRVSAYQQWIDQSLRANYPNAPTKPDEVKREVSEGNGGTSYAYFLLQFTGVRSDPNQVLSVDYATRDGTAFGGNDYLSVTSTLKLYPNENQAVIPVEIIGDAIPEHNEFFYLDVFNPVGGSFGEGVVKLTAVRTILNDDGFFG